MTVRNNLLPNEVLSIIILKTMDPFLCSRVCKAWAQAIQLDPFFYVKIFEDWMKNKNIIPLLIYLPEFVPNPMNVQAAYLVEAAFRLMVEQVQEYKPCPEKTFCAVFPYFENVQTMKLIAYREHWDVSSKFGFVPPIHPKKSRITAEEEATQIRDWMKQGLNLDKFEQTDKILDWKARKGTKIKEAYFVSFGILSLPSEFFEQMRKVVSIILRRNLLQSLPPGVSACKRLIVLDLQDNPIKSLPRELGLCPNLLAVYIDKDAFEEAHIPEEIKHLIKARESNESYEYSSSEDDDDLAFQQCLIS